MIDRIEVRFHINKNGRSFVNDWLERLDRNYRKRIVDRVIRIKHGNIGDHKPVGSGVYELRFDFGSGYRIYFGKEENKIIILLYGGDKKTQKSDIEKAKKYWQEYQENRE